MSKSPPQTPEVHFSSFSEHVDTPLESQTHVQTAESEAREETMACWLFALVGIGFLFPFSALTQPVDYWNMLFPDFNIEFAITCVFMYTNLVFLIGLVVCFVKPQYSGRIVGGFIGQLVVLVFVPTSYFFLSSDNANIIAVLGATAIAAVATAFIDSCAIALVSHYPQRVQESFQLGIGLSALIGSIYRDFTKLMFPEDQLLASSLIYFYTGALTIAVCITAYYKAMNLQITKKYLLTGDDSDTEVEKRLSIDGAGRISSKWSVFKKVWHLELLILCVYLASLSVWPPLVTEIKTYNFPSLEENGWWSLILLTIFSTFDCVGRFVVNHRFGLKPSNIWMPIFARFILVPLIIGIVKEWWLQSDVFSVICVLLLGFGNGYLGALTIIFVSESVKPDEQHIIGPVTSFFLNLGLVLGSTYPKFDSIIVSFDNQPLRSSRPAANARRFSKKAAKPAAPEPRPTVRPTKQLLVTELKEVAKLMFGGLAVTSVLIASGGFVIETVKTLNPMDPPGFMMQISGSDGKPTDVHVQRRGSGDVTVLFDGGVGETSFDWDKVADDVAKFATVLSIDRPGLGFSKPGVLPRTSTQVVNEYKQILEKLNVTGKVVLVAHGAGGYNMRELAEDLKNSVHGPKCEGLVLVDALQENLRGELESISDTVQKSLSEMDNNGEMVLTLSRIGLIRLVNVVQSPKLAAKFSPVALPFVQYYSPSPAHPYSEFPRRS
ncbi:Equilibrative nucleotide transporter 1 [Phytophthora citrophthora]|uniref:Equilibrative nucleotide transporter 1 n=1 Tax=Phytophthora citrophthora TaxID=4793 RepID=A0AAD9LCP7_9STRA|nr:Equilibrative nucleotide transporter 1 [Phytophthora citrophthora]